MSVVNLRNRTAAALEMVQRGIPEGGCFIETGHMPRSRLTAFSLDNVTNVEELTS